MWSWILPHHGNHMWRKLLLWQEKFTNTGIKRRNRVKKIKKVKQLLKITRKKLQKPTPKIFLMKKHTPESLTELWWLVWFVTTILLLLEALGIYVLVGFWTFDIGILTGGLLWMGGQWEWTQLNSHIRFANAFPRFCKLVDDARLYCTTNAPPTPVWTIVPLCAEMFDFTLSVLKCDECFNTAFVGE